MNITPTTRNKYLMALNELVGSLSVNEYRAVAEISFCERYDLKASFFPALRDLDGVVYDVVSESGYKSTVKLPHITPEDVIKQMRGQGGKTATVDVQKLTFFPNPYKVKNDPVTDERPKITGVPDDAEIVDRIPADWNGPASSIVMDKSDVPTLNIPPAICLTIGSPYTVTIAAEHISMSLRVATSIDADILNAVLSRLNRP